MEASQASADNQSQPKQIVAKSFPLSGNYLIEASAGTGKTYTITSLYLRLIIGHGYQLKDNRAYTVDQILLVTFTEAATSELKGRIHSSLKKAFQGFSKGTSDDPFIASLIEETEHHSLVCQRLDMAIKQLDEAAIFTIHGFCQRMLQLHAFESGSAFSLQFSTDESSLLERAGNDFWREHIYPLNRSQTLFVFQNLWKSPQLLMKQVRSYLNKPSITLLPEAKYSDQLWQNFEQQSANSVSKLKMLWQQENIAELLPKLSLVKNRKPAKPTYQQALYQFFQSEEADVNQVDFSIWTSAAINKAKTKSQPEIEQQFFRVCEELVELQQKNTLILKSALMSFAILQVRKLLLQHKIQQGLLLPDDLLTGLHSALNHQTEEQNQQLADRIFAQFPVAFIDEFQDTDPIQYQIFNRIYAEQPNGLWLMIGDPKQAIYGFRGADIFTYIQAKQDIAQSNHYSLDTNWRSHSELINAINQLFWDSEKGFLFKQQIPFVSVKAAGKADKSELTRKNSADLREAAEVMNFMHFVSQSKLPSTKVVKQQLALGCANKIVELLSPEAGYMLDSKPVTGGDVSVLVRDRNEAQQIKEALTLAGISSVFLSRESVFTSEIAYPLYTLMCAIHQPQREELIRAALMTPLIGFSSQELDQANHDQHQWQQILIQFQHYHQLWFQQGIMACVRLLLEQFQSYRKIVKLQYSERLITDMRHLLELLQQQSQQFQGMPRLLRWYATQLSEPEATSDSQMLRLESDSNLVQIITMHGSKGLEYPIVFMPFACWAKPQKEAIFNYQQSTYLDIAKQKQNLQQAEVERLAEDMRLLYVGLTRAVYSCYIGVYDSCEGRSKQSLLLQSALGQLLLSGFDTNDNGEQNLNNILQQRIEQLQDQLCGVSYLVIDESQSINTYKAPKEHQTGLGLTSLDLPIETNYRVTSFSALTRNRHNANYNEQADDINVDNSLVLNQQSYHSQFSFPRGAHPGSFLHGVLENWDFNDQQQLQEIIGEQGEKFAIDPEYNPMLFDWMNQIVAAPLNAKGLTLNSLQPSDFLPEMEFMLPLKNLNQENLNRVIADNATVNFKPIHFQQMAGMLKGFIDLIFVWQGRFYILDYKSNYLGDQIDDYEQRQMQQSMLEHDYFLQAWFYTLALHRFLKNNLPDYDYQKHMGGSLYLFLRGISDNQRGDKLTSKGVFFLQPEEELIEALDQCFEGQTIESKTPESGQLGLF